MTILDGPTSRYVTWIRCDSCQRIEPFFASPSEIPADLESLDWSGFNEEHACPDCPPLCPDCGDGTDGRCRPCDDTAREDAAIDAADAQRKEAGLG